MVEDHQHGKKDLEIIQIVLSICLALRCHIGGKECLIPISQDGVERGKGAVDLLGGGPASPAASLD